MRIQEYSTMNDKLELNTEEEGFMSHTATNLIYF